jgi:hypothetical protein
MLFYKTHFGCNLAFLAFLALLVHVANNAKNAKLHPK